MHHKPLKSLKRKLELTLPGRLDRDGPLLSSVCIGIVKNEQDIIEPFLRHNHRFFDLMVILDNRSTDRTREIVADCARELGNVVMADRPEFAYHQSLFMTQAMFYVQSACFADFMAFLDADEFLDAPDRAAFDAALKTVPVGQAALLPWRTFLPAAQAAASGDPLAGMNQRRRRENPVYYKAVMRLGGLVDTELSVDMGNHGFHRFEKRVPARQVGNLGLMHFPLRSITQLRAKGLVNWKAELARHADGKGTGHCYQWERIHDLVMDPACALGTDMLVSEAMAYAQNEELTDFQSNTVPEDHGIDLTRKYSDGTFADPEKLARDSETQSVMHGQDFPLPGDARNGEAQAGQMTLDAPPFRFLAEKHRPESVLDFGCGDGARLKLLQHSGVRDIHGVGRHTRDATLLDPGDYTTGDLEKPFSLERRFELVICVELLEHMQPDATQTLIATLTAHAESMILFSVADPGQPGVEQRNCFPMREVLDIWEAAGWTPDLCDTLAVRSLSTAPCFRRNLIVLRPEGQTGTPTEKAKSILNRIGDMPFTWYEPHPGIRLAPFTDPLPGPRCGYAKRQL